MPTAPHPLSLLWLMLDQAQLRALGPTIREVYDQALARDTGTGDRAVVIGALQARGGSCLFDSDVVTLDATDPLLRPTFNTLFGAVDAIEPLIGKGLPQDPAALQLFHTAAARRLESRGVDAGLAPIFAEAAIAALWFAHEPELMVMVPHPDGRLLCLNGPLLNRSFLAYMEDRVARTAAAE